MVRHGGGETAVADDFRERAAQWLRGNVPDEWRDNRGALDEAAETRLRAEWDRRLYEGGFAGIALPVEYGGQGRSVEDEVAFFELAAHMQAPDSLGRIGKILTAPTLITLGTDAQKAKYLPKILSGRKCGARAFRSREPVRIWQACRRWRGGRKVDGSSEAPRYGRASASTPTAV